MTPRARTTIVWGFGVVCAGLFLGALFSNSQIVELLGFIAMVVLSVVAVLTGLAGRNRAVRQRMMQRARGAPRSSDQDQPEQAEDTRR